MRYHEIATPPASGHCAGRDRNFASPPTGKKPNAKEILDRIMRARGVHRTSIRPPIQNPISFRIPFDHAHHAAPCRVREIRTWCVDNLERPSAIEREWHEGDTITIVCSSVADAAYAKLRWSAGFPPPTTP